MYSEFSLNYELYIRHFLLNYVVYKNSFYAFIKTQNIKPKKSRILLIFALNLIVSLVYSFLMTRDMIVIAQILSYLIIILSLCLLTPHNKNKYIIVGLISACYAHVLKTASYFLSFIIVYVSFGVLLNLVPYIFTCIISMIINFLLLKIRRVKNGIQFFEKTDNMGIGLIISGVVFIISVIGYNKSIDKIFIIIIAFGVSISGFGLYLWIKKSITKHYREKQQLKSELEYKKQLEQKELEIEKLNHSNEYLAKIVHRDNHLMSSLDSSINAYFESGDKEFMDDIIREIQTFSKERGDLIKTEQINLNILPSTGNNLIDSTIKDFYIKAVAHGIDFDVSVSATVDEVIGKYISQTDLQTLICDHIKDAIIAVDAKNENNGKILAELSMENDNYTISIFDSGVDFEIDTLAKLGKERVTTHADNGGSGIGFMTTFETIRKSYASLIITEFANKTPFSKSISIRFDGNTAFIIQSYRKEELQSALNRDDVILL